MSLSGAIYSSVSGMRGFASEAAMRSDNAANSGSKAYKSFSPIFSTVTTNTYGTALYSSGGVAVSIQQNISKEGGRESTDSPTDMAIQGKGFFVANTRPDLSGDWVYTRLGNFFAGQDGSLQNTSGYTLATWPLDNETNLPGQNGNTNTTPYTLLTSLAPLNTKSLSGGASATSSITLGSNLNAQADILKGTGDTFVFAPSSVNYEITNSQIIIPDATANYQLTLGDDITLSPSDPNTTYTFEYGGVVVGNNIATANAGAGIFGATTTTQPFSTASGATANDGFTIVTTVNSNSVTYTFTFKPSSPDETQGEFNSLLTLQKAINSVSGGAVLSRITSNTLYVANSDGDADMTFANFGAGGTNCIGAANLNLANIASNIGGTIPRFSNLSDLAGKISTKEGLAVSNYIGSGKSISFYATDPQGTLGIAGIAGGGTNTELLSQFGISHASGYTYPSAYNPAISTKNMAGGTVLSTESSTENIQIFDALGIPHNIKVSFGKIADNEWSVEIYMGADSLNDIVSSRTDGQIANGTITFNGNGTLNSLSSSLSSAIPIVWNNGASPSSITFEWGTAGPLVGTISNPPGQADGMRQNAAKYQTYVHDQNGVSAGDLDTLSVDGFGIVTATFKNGTSRAIAQVPIAMFASPNNLSPVSGNAYSSTTASGSINLTQAGTGAAGKVQSSTLELSNTELSDELTKMIIAQRAYQSNAKMLKSSNDMLEELYRAI